MGLGSLLTFVGVIALVAQDMTTLLPKQLGSFIINNAILILVSGLGLHGVKVFSLVQRARQNSDKSQVIDSSPQPELKSRYAPGNDLANDTSGSSVDGDAHKLLNNSFDVSDVDWSPVKKGGTNITSHRLRVINAKRIEVFATWQIKVFSLFFAGFGGSIGTFMSVAAWRESGGLIVLFPAGIGLIFVAVGLALYYSTGQLGVFDKSLGWYWRSRKQQNETSQIIAQMKEKAKLNEVQALQLLTERVTSSKGASYKSYELNLILANNARINVMDHGSKRVINESAQQLSLFLSVPIVGESSWSNLDGG